ncbi:MAG: DUF4392 domain-containing protein [Spirochaetales bacterium]|nr:DUF4392 domain-containing protein [Spirochaetales bacterium]
MITEFDLSADSIAQTARNLELFIQQDPGGRGLARWALNGTLFPATLSLAGGDHIIIATGFYILAAGAIETDGPLGAIILADALKKMGKDVTIITDSHAYDVMMAGINEIDPEIELIVFDVGVKIEFNSIIKKNTTHFIALERPGVAADGFHHNFRGAIISDYVAAIDDIFLKCASYGIITVGIGDGGNELGMGNVRRDVETYIAPYRDYSCQIVSDYCVCAGVSNWAGYAVAGLLALLAKRHLMPSFDAFDAMFDKIVGAGAVDGVSGVQETTVDGLLRKWEDRIYSSMHALSSNFS